MYFFESSRSQIRNLKLMVEFPRKNGHGYAEFFFRNSTGLI
ncbi:hypothetical protein LEP1GSC040_1724 [Leptospira santarosai str. 2000030832]|uniref:Uncharacterized protein n=1 Tax=Leptospira santarosai serovar Arenal str. MAVJ 401 TaxID=1049976 RepID=M6JSG9_9LEPT|nr:hypothetical protein LEP1GSC040_1724 [Leptospira santarosai str. 2000030832]EMN22553.1 hypothetical protein LEP1GSC063_2808 [Leptospira santarosai serovar Arenal str. MAVJ 401]